MESTDQLNGIFSTRAYVDRLISGDNRCHGMKVLLLDSTTTQIVSCVASQSEILNRQVYLVCRLDDLRGHSGLISGGGSHSLELKEEISSTVQMSHMKAVCFLRPTSANIGLLIKELSQPRFSEYHIFFSGIVPKSMLNLLAENDEKERVRQVQEFYADFLPINEDLWSLNCRNTLQMDKESSYSSQHHLPNSNQNISLLYQRNLMGLQSMLLASKRRPYAIRYQKSSNTARRLALDINESITSDEIFHFRRGTGVGGGAGNFLLLILDRLDDPVTPLLSQWTYQAMVHELLGLNNNRVILRGVPNVSKDLEEVVLSSAPGHDPFFASHRNSNFGELGEAIQKLLREYQARSKEYQASNLKSIDDMQNFIEKFPELRSQSHTVSKHVALMGELARLVEVCSLMDVSAFEQDLACSDDQAGHLRQLMSKLDSSSVKIPDKLRLALLYALRYENATPNNAIEAVKEAIKRGGVPASNVALIDAILRYAGAKVRGPGLYGTNKDLVSKMTKSFMTSVQGVSNVYSQHSPLLMDTVEAVIKGKLWGESHPLVLSGAGSSLETLPLPQEVLVFMVGGVTYEEATKVNEFNQLNSGKIRIILGGSTIHNSTSFLDELKQI